jgi:hypothetical protein
MNGDPQNGDAWDSPQILLGETLWVDYFMIIHVDLVFIDEMVI